ncbi:MAG: outer membrane protein assembly factor BamD [Bacteroidaceae bacterium]|nr:outer membrane protein assembly factor BamD [Bacteroidaceae bacterium]
MKLRHLLVGLAAVATLTACSDYAKVLKSHDAYYKYEAAKEYYTRGQYARTATLLNEVLPALRGTELGEEALYLHGSATLKAKDYDAAATILRKYYTDYPRGQFAEQASYNCGIALYKSTPEVKLDQTPTYEAVTELSRFIERYPRSPLTVDARDKIFELQDKLVEKEWLSAKLYYDLGSYFLNCSKGGSNYQACIVTAENAIRDYPYTPRKEEFAFLIVRAKFGLADQSVSEKKEERLVSAIDEYHSFIDEFPQSVHRSEADQLYRKYSRQLNRPIQTEEEEA